MPRRSGPYNADKWISPSAEPGDMVPSELPHARRPPNPGERRITMSFNAIPTRLDLGYAILQWLMAGGVGRRNGSSRPRKSTFSFAPTTPPSNESSRIGAADKKRLIQPGEAHVAPASSSISALGSGSRRRARVARDGRFHPIRRSVWFTRSNFMQTTADVASGNEARVHGWVIRMVGEKYSHA